MKRVKSYRINQLNLVFSGNLFSRVLLAKVAIVKKKTRSPWLHCTACTNEFFEPSVKSSSDLSMENVICSKLINSTISTTLNRTKLFNCLCFFNYFVSCSRSNNYASLKSFVLFLLFLIIPFVLITSTLYMTLNLMIVT